MSALGDFVLHSAAIREIRRLYPCAHITLLVNERVSSLAKFCPYVDELLVIRRIYAPNFLNDFWYNILFVDNLLKRRFDICYAFTMFNSTPFLMYMSGARIRITQAREWDASNPFEYPLKESVKLATHLFSSFGRHAVDDNLALIDGMLGMPVANRAIEVWYTLLRLLKPSLN